MSIFLYAGHHTELTKIEPKINWFCALGNFETWIKCFLYGHGLTLEHPHPSRYFLCPRTPSSVYRNLFLAIFGVFLAPVLRYF